MKPRASLFSTYQDLQVALPVGEDHATSRRREDLFDSFDVEGNGVCFQRDVVRGLFRRLPVVDGIVDMTLVVSRGFRATTEAVPSIIQISANQMDRVQFSVLLRWLWNYFRVWEAFMRRDSRPGRKATVEDLPAVLHLMREWDCDSEAEGWEANPRRAFSQLHRRAHDGELPFDDFAEACIRCCLQKWKDDISEKEKGEALQQLKRTMPHLLGKVPTNRRPGFTGSAPPVPPPGQKQPPPSVFADALAGRTLAQRRWTSQYHADFKAPREVPEAQKPQAVPCPSAQGYAWQRPGGVVLAMAKSRSSPSALGSTAARAGGQERVALRSKLDRQLDMYSTRQMRNLLSRAGELTMNQTATATSRGGSFSAHLSP